MRNALLVTIAALILAAPADAAALAPLLGQPIAGGGHLVFDRPPRPGEWYLKGWGPFFDNAPQKKFWLGFIPFYGWPGYLQVKSAIDSHNCRVNDNL